jgi:uncharacterized membrane protein
MNSPESTSRRINSAIRLLVMAATGIIAACILGALGFWQYAPIVGWAVAAAVYVVWVWLLIYRMDAAATSSHATREDPTRGTTDLLLLLASVASLVVIAVLLIGSKSAHGTAKALLPLIVIASVALSWFLVHTLFTLRYAALYYADDAGGVDFNQKESPRYLDFAYLAFTLGMTFQVSDTNLTRFAIRSTALRHGLLSYLFGAVILATAVNLVASLAS